MMNRRSFLSLISSSPLLYFGMLSPKEIAAASNYTGKFFVTLQLNGGWDVSSLCDPKPNSNGTIINNWATTKTPQRSGNLMVAPIANNVRLFNKFSSSMLVVNGIDTQTNSHSVGVTHSWSGRNSVGYPSISALFASTYGQSMPMAYLNFGGYGVTSGLVRTTRINNMNSLVQILDPNKYSWAQKPALPDTLWTLIRNRQSDYVKSSLASNSLLPRQRQNMTSYLDAQSRAPQLKDFLATLPDPSSFQGPVSLGFNLSNSTLMTQIQSSLHAFYGGVSCAADLYLDGFDTHSSHDDKSNALLSHLADAVEYLMSYAGQLGIADRLIVLISSDFSRTPSYNSSNGKDHWPIGSAILLELGQTWGNRTVGLTDFQQNAVKINPSTLAQDPNGILLYPKHVHKALRNYLGIDKNPSIGLFPLNNTEDVSFFDPSRTSA